MQTPSEPTRPFENALGSLAETLRSDMDDVNQDIIKHLQSQITLIPALAQHLIAAGGKRLRPLLTLASARLCDYHGTLHIPLACAIEFIHTATLLHDDVIDESDNRRGQATANHIWGNKASVLVGDFLFSRAFAHMVQAHSLPILHVLAEASSQIAEGEVMQLLAMRHVDTREDAYFEIIQSKTARLFEASCHVSALLSNVPDDQIQALRQFGHHLGMAFQLVDDALDYQLDAQTGKPGGRDFFEGKMTLPSIIAYQQGDAAERDFWARTMEQSLYQENDLQVAIRSIQAHDGLRATLDRAMDHAHQASEALKIFPATPMRQQLHDLAMDCVDRRF
jgi:octaprenyl-diphosphate synthase